MKSTLADIKQLFNVKDIAYSTTIENLAEGQFGIFPEDSDTSVATGTTFATLPEKFRLISKLGGKVYYSFDTITKSRITDKTSDDYQAEVVNVWETVIQAGCDCTKGVELRVNLDERSLEMRDGLSWTHLDFFVEVSPSELACLCKEDTNGVYENNYLTAVLDSKIKAINSPFYTSEVTADISGVTVYADEAARDAAEPNPTKGDLAVVTADNVLTQYNGTEWVTVGDNTGTITDASTFAENNKDLNTDADDNNDGLKLTLVLKGKVQSGALYADLDVNYIYPRGVKLNPVLTVNDGEVVEFTQTTALQFERNSGYDLRAEEFECMNFYTDLNYYPQLSDGIQSKNLVYQFENGVNYDLVTFEFGSKKSGLESVFEGDYKMFGVCLGAEAGSAEATELKSIFTA